MKNLIALALLASLAACSSENTTTPAPEATETPVENTDGPCGDGRELGENEVCP
jgi:hypothetical protein